MHIYDFITDEFHFELKEKARNRPNRLPFEKVLLEYTSLFKNYLDNSITLEEEPGYLHPILRNSPAFSNWLKEFYGIFINEIGNIKRIMDECVEIYHVFIRGKNHNAVLRMHDLLDRYNLLDKIDGELLGGFFRCRWCSNPEATIGNDADFFYHIPFDKRFLISNQRFSVSGIPMLYLGSSLATSAFELGIKDLSDSEFDKLAISFWGFNHGPRTKENWTHGIQNRMNVYDISNLVFDIINDVILDILIVKDEDERERIIENYSLLNRENLRIAIRKFGIAQVCTFVADQFYRKPATHNDFYEEYILPQILTEAIRLHKYDGIVYPSTKYSNRKIESRNGWMTGVFKNNLVMFSHYSDNSPYDSALIKNFIIDKERFSAIRMEVIRGKIIEDIRIAEMHLIFIKEYIPLDPLARKFRSVLIFCKKRLRLLQVIQIDKQNYLDTIIGNMEAQYVSEYLKFVMQDIRVMFSGDFEKFETDIEKGIWKFPWMESANDLEVNNLY